MMFYLESIWLTLELLLLGSLLVKFLRLKISLNFQPILFFSINRQKVQLSLFLKIRFLNFPLILTMLKKLRFFWRLRKISKFQTFDKGFQFQSKMEDIIILTLLLILTSLKLRFLRIRSILRKLLLELARLSLLGFLMINRFLVLGLWLEFW